MKHTRTVEENRKKQNSDLDNEFNLKKQHLQRKAKRKMSEGETKLYSYSIDWNKNPRNQQPHGGGLLQINGTHWPFTSR